MNEETRHDASTLVENQLDCHLRELERLTKADLLVFDGDLLGKSDDIIRDAVEGRKRRRRKLVVILETNGGYAEVAERIARTFRKHYSIVEFIVPNSAMSAGTILVMSGDAIHMDYYSVLGPIDPQVEKNDSNNPIPVNGYLKQYEQLVEKANEKNVTTAELTLLIEKFDAGELYRYQQEMNLSVTLLKQWLVKYKFKTWKRTKTRHLKVTTQMKMKRAEAIAKTLNDSDEWHVHSRGIPMAVLRKRLKLVIEDFEKNKPLREELRRYTKLLNDYMMKSRCAGAIHTIGNFTSLWR